MAELIGIAVRPVENEPVVELDETTIDTKGGVAGDYGGGGKGRQVTVLSQSDWQESCHAIGADLAWTTRRANLFVADIGSFESAKGRRIQIGDVLLEVTGETKPCHKMEAAKAGLRDALDSGWRGGVTCRVLHGGKIKVGDSVAISEPVAS